MPLSLFLVFLVFSLFSEGSSDLALLRADSSHWSHTLCTVYNPDWGQVPVTDHPSSQYRAEEASDVLACGPQNLTNEGGALVCLRGNCSFCEKAQNAESAGAKLLVVVYNESHLLVEPVCGRGDHTPSIPVLLVTNESGWHILNTLTLTNLTLAPFSPHTSTFDPAAVLTLVIAMVTVVLGSLIANTPFQYMRYGLLVRRGESIGGSHDNKREEGGSMSVAMTILAILVFLALLCTLLLLLYYFYYPMVYVVIAMYCVGACFGLFYLLSPLAALIPCFKNIRLPANRLPVLEYRPDSRFPVTVLVCVAITVWWLLERHSDYGWILQDILRFAFVAHILSRMLFLPTWVVAVAMVFLFFYDIIMVFITPFLTRDHESVMVKAATGGGGGNTEPLPIVFIVPKLLSSAVEKVCPASLTGHLPYSLLGYGDVGVPGVLVALSLKYDMNHRPGHWFRLYYCVSSLAYCVGLCFTYLALSLMKTAQPALLYLVPTTLGCVVVVSLCRREFRQFFSGSHRGQKVTGHKEEGGEAEAADSKVRETDTELECSDDSEREKLINGHH